LGSTGFEGCPSKFHRPHKLIKKINEREKQEPTKAWFMNSWPRMTATQKILCKKKKKSKSDDARKLSQLINQSNPSNSLFGWNIFVTNTTLGGLLGYSSVNLRFSLKVPPSQGVASGLFRFSQKKEETNNSKESGSKF
jgi:hypothetical protein